MDRALAVMQSMFAFNTGLDKADFPVRIFVRASVRSKVHESYLHRLNHGPVIDSIPQLYLIANGDSRSYKRIIIPNDTQAFVIFHF